MNDFALLDDYDRRWCLCCCNCNRVLDGAVGGCCFGRNVRVRTATKSTWQGWRGRNRLQQHSLESTIIRATGALENRLTKRIITYVISFVLKLVNFNYIIILLIRARQLIVLWSRFIHSLRFDMSPSRTQKRKCQVFTFTDCNSFEDEHT